MQPTCDTPSHAAQVALLVTSHNPTAHPAEAATQICQAMLQGLVCWYPYQQQELCRCSPKESHHLLWVKPQESGVLSKVQD